ncbi:MAG: hypothetical protein ABIK96_04395 [bacterium]
MYHSACRPRRVPAVISACLMLLLYAPGAVAQASGPPDWNRQGDTLEGALGLHYGKLGGHGLAFRLPLRWYLYAQVAGGVWHTGDHKQHNLGFQFNYLLRQDQRLRLYLAAGAAYFYDKELKGGGGDPEYWQLEDDWNLGGGVGIEYLKGNRWSIQAEADFVHDGANDETKLVPQVGLYFYW